MLRPKVALVAALAAILWTLSTGQAQGLKGGKFEGELKGKSKPSINLVVDGKVKSLRDVWTQELPIALKAGQSVSLSVSVVGKGRKVALALVNPSGKTIATTVKLESGLGGGLPVPGGKQEWGGKTAQLEFEEVGAAGKYSIVVISDEAGPFTLRTTGPATKDLDEKALKQKIEELEEELADLKKKLKALDKKK